MSSKVFLIQSEGLGKGDDKLGAMLKEQGITLEELMDSGREIRGQITAEKYHLTDD